MYIAVKKLLLLIPVILFTIGCREDLNIYRDSDYLPVIYCVYCPDDSFIKVKVGRSFQGDQSAYVTAMIPDTAFLSSLKVTLDLLYIDPGLLVASQVIPFTLINDRLNGMFYQSPNYCFVKNPDIPFTMEPGFRGGTLRLTVYDPALNRYTVGESTLIPRPEILGPNTESGTFQASFYSRDPFLVTYKNAGVAYELKIDFCYREVGINNYLVTDTISWSIPIPYTYDETLSVYRPVIAECIIYGTDFFMEVGRRIPVKAGVTRLFDSFTLKLYAMDPVLRVYEDLYHSVTDIDPGLTSNIANGLGIFACARRSEVKGLRLDPRSMDSLCSGSVTRKLRFQRW